nr:MAG TPA: hypothetical protein [Caudoviricetes sp.]
MILQIFYLPNLFINIGFIFNEKWPFRFLLKKFLWV